MSLDLREFRMLGSRLRQSLACQCHFARPEADKPRQFSAFGASCVKANPPGFRYFYIGGCSSRVDQTFFDPGALGLAFIEEDLPYGLAAHTATCPESPSSLGTIIVGGIRSDDLGACNDVQTLLDAQPTAETLLYSPTLPIRETLPFPETCGIAFHTAHWILGKLVVLFGRRGEQCEQRVSDKIWFLSTSQVEAIEWSELLVSHGPRNTQ